MDQSEGIDRGAHNELSGRAHAAAQADTINGGVHFHGQFHGQPGGPGHVAWCAHGCLVVLVVIGLLVVGTSRKDDPHKADAGTSGQTSGNAAAGPVRERRIADQMKIPRQLDVASYRLLVAIPELVEAVALQGYRCNDELYSRVNIVYLETERFFGDMTMTAMVYVDKLMRLNWVPGTWTRYRALKEVSRSAQDGEHRYFGMQLDVEVTVPAGDPCASTVGVVKALVLDHGDRYLVYVVVAGLNGDPRYAAVPTERDLEDLMDNLRPGS